MKSLPYIVIAILAIAAIVIGSRRSERTGAIRMFPMGEALNDLERAILSAQPTPESSAEILSTFRTSTVFLLAKTEAYIEGHTILKEDTAVQFKGWTEGDRTFILAFSAVERLMQSGLAGERYIGMNGESCLEVLDPFVTVVLNHRFDDEIRLVFDENLHAWSVLRRAAKVPEDTP